MSLNLNQFLYVLNCNSAKEMCDALEMIYRESPSIEQEGMNTRGEDVECECFFHKCFSTFRNIGNNVRTFFANKYIRIKSWNQKPESTLKSRDVNVYSFQEKMKKEEIIENLHS